MEDGIFKRKSLVKWVWSGVFLMAALGWAAPVTTSMARKAAETHINAKSGVRDSIPRIKLYKPAATVGELKELLDPQSGDLIGYVAELKPKGFIVLSANTSITPIIAYSFRCDFPWEEHPDNILLAMVRRDLALREQAVARLNTTSTATNNSRWQAYLSANKTMAVVEQWPPEGSTPTGGWVTTTWHQVTPYNNSCPVDPGTGDRSVVGCVATAMSQIVNYHADKTNYLVDFRFDDADDYLSDGSSPSVFIDDDAFLYDFPDFSSLNLLLNDVEQTYAADIPLDNTDLAALCFACGVTVEMQYSSAGSGAYTSDVAGALLEKLDYKSAIVMNPSEGQAEFYDTLADNMKNALPAELSIAWPDYTRGHAIVCDGYRTRDDGPDEYHLNFGWGPSSPDPIVTAWYVLPEGMPAGYSIIKYGIVSIVPPEGTSPPPQEPELIWTYQTPTPILSSAAVDDDWNIYFGSEDDYLYALYPDGTLKWRCLTGGNVSASPAVGSDGTIYAPSYDGHVYAINPDGTLKWEYDTETMNLIYSSPAIASDGSVYFGSFDGGIYALYPEPVEDELLKWRYQTGDNIYSSPAIDQNGNVYIGSADNYLYCLDPDGNLNWSYRTDGIIVSSPAIEVDGNVYFGSYDGYLYSLYPDGSLRWQCWIGSQMFSSPSLGPDGTIYIGTDDATFYAVTPSGDLDWIYYTGGGYIASSPAIGADSTIYVGAGDSYLHAISPDGIEKWRYQTNDVIHASVAFGEDDLLLIGSRDGVFYALDAETGGMSAETPWPKYRHDERNTGNVGYTSAPRADFSGVPKAGPVPLTVLFTDLSTGDPIAWRWDFGDGRTSTTQNPVHFYDLEGLYTVSLHVIYTDGEDTETKIDYIYVGPIVNADFTGTPTSGYVPLDVSFTDLSTGHPTTWQWDFGDGEVSSDQNPSHRYDQEGTYDVKLVAGNQGSEDTEIKQSYVTVYLERVADFAGVPSSGSPPLTVDFTDLSTGNPISWDWDFGDGETSILQNPTHIYEYAGNYTVRLTVTWSDTVITVTKDKYIRVGDVPVADFDADPSDGCMPLSARFIDKSSNYPVVWRWDFGDGSTSSNKNPYHLYQDHGSYTVTLIVSNALGEDTEIKEDFITVNAPRILLMEDQSLVAELYPDSTITLSFHIADTSQCPLSFIITESLTPAPQKVLEESRIIGSHTEIKTAKSKINKIVSATTLRTLTPSTDPVCPVEPAGQAGPTSGDQQLIPTQGYLDVSWLSPAPTSGMVLGKNYTTIEVTFDARGLEINNYTAWLVIESEDPYQQFSYVSCTLSVIPVPGISEGILAVPTHFFLEDIKPNPVSSNSMISVSYGLPKATDVQIAVYDIGGRLVKALVEGQMPAGFHEVSWDCNDINGHKVPAGIYFCRMLTTEFKATNKIIMIRSVGLREEQTGNNPNKPSG
ncbi:PQQ-binding-like beta-propeller repeat protein [candidate division WOR-3 bacterium]|nr:PQQ-binding-like beta-propeller repeat protein [candidate division WOR-3 bacterium]